MANKSKEKKKKNTKEKDLINLDNEIIIGLRTLPETEVKRKKKNTKKTNPKKKKTKAQEKQTKTNNQEDKINLDEEDIFIKPRQTKEKKGNKKKTTKKLTKGQEIARKKRKRAFRIIKWTSLVLLLIGGGVYFLLSSFFNIKTITTSGNEKIPSEELISLSGIQLETNTFKISNSKVEKAIKENAYVESIKVKRKLPDKIELQIVERKPAYMLAVGNAYVYINTQGYLLEVSKTALKLPIIVGTLTPEEDIEVGNRLCAEDLQRLSSVIQIMDSANNNNIGDLVTRINIEDKQDYILELKSEKKTVHVGDTSNLSTKMLYVKSVLEKEKKAEGEIFVNTDLYNKGAVFREKV